MWKVAVLLIGTSLAVPTNCFASVRADKERAVMEAQGIFQSFEKLVKRGKEQRQQQVEQIINEFKAHHNLSSELDEKMKVELDQLRRTYEENLASVQGRLDVWAQSYFSQFTDDELDQLMAYYTSPLGRKDVLASDQAGQEVSKHVATKVGQAITELAQRVQLIEKECNCRK